MGRIYSDIDGEILTTEGKEKMLYLYDHNGSRYRPNLIVPNLLAMKRLRDFLDAIVQKHPGYFKKVGEPLEKRVVKK
jgi:hypothetical protein